MEMIEQCNNAVLEITVGDVFNAEEIARFQVAMESEGIALDKSVCVGECGPCWTMRPKADML